MGCICRRIQQLQQENEKLQVQINELKEEYRILESKNEKIAQQLKDCIKDKIDLKNQYEIQQKELENLTNEYESIVSQLKDCNQDKINLKKLNQQILNQNEKYEQEIQTLRNQVNDLQKNEKKQLSQFQEKIQQLKSEITTLTEENKRLQKQYNFLDNQSKKLQVSQINSASQIQGNYSFFKSSELKEEKEKFEDILNNLKIQISSYQQQEKIYQLKEKQNQDQIGKLNEQLKNYQQPLIKHPEITLPFKSKVLTDPDLQEILLTLFEEINVKLYPLFSASKNHFSNEKFHQVCDHKGPTFIIMQSTEENCFFGGFSYPAWHSSRCYSTDQENQCSWLYKIQKSLGKISLHQWKCSIKEQAIFGSISFGPYFGNYEEDYGLKYLLRGKSHLPFSDESPYQKVNLAEELSNSNMRNKQKLYELVKEKNIELPEKSVNGVMSETYFEFTLIDYEVFQMAK